MIAENQKVELFDEFYNWLVADGLKAKKSERLHRKKIFASLMANKEMTLDNFKDFLAYKEEDEKRAFITRIENLESEQAATVREKQELQKKQKTALLKLFRKLFPP